MGQWNEKKLYSRSLTRHKNIGGNCTWSLSLMFKKMNCLEKAKRNIQVGYVGAVICGKQLWNLEPVPGFHCNLHK